MTGDKGAAIDALNRIAQLAEDAAGITDEDRWAIHDDYETVMAHLAAPQNVVDALIPPSKGDGPFLTPLGAI